MREPSKTTRTRLAALLLFSLSLSLSILLSGCNEKPVIYSERIAILPDKSGYLCKEVRSLDKTRTEMAIKEMVGETTKEIFVIALADFQDVKFKTQIKGDTICLIHTQTGLAKAMQAIGKSSVPVKQETVSGAEWLSAGVTEGDPLFYAPDKWDGLLALMKRN